MLSTRGMQLFPQKGDLSEALFLDHLNSTLKRESELLYLAV